MEEGRKEERKGKKGNCEVIARRRCGRLLGDRREKVAAKKVKAIFPLTDELERSRWCAAAGEPRPHLFHGSQQEQPTANRCIAGAHPERHRECRGELKSFTST